MFTQKNITTELKKIKITKDDYQIWVKQLIKLGYTIEQANKLILRPSAKNGIKGVLEYTNLLSPQFTHDQIIFIAFRHGGYQNLKAIDQKKDVLNAYGFTTDNIVKITGSMGGSKNVNAVLLNIDALFALHLTPTHIAQIVGHPGGSGTIKAVLKAANSFITLNFTPDDIARLAGTPKGSKNIAAFLEYQIEMPALARSVKDTINFVLKNIKLQAKNKLLTPAIKNSSKKVSVQLSAVESKELKTEVSMVAENAPIPQLETIIEPHNTFVGCNQHMLFRANPTLKNTLLNGKISSEIADQLSLFKIEEQDYINWKTRLLTLGYTEYHVNQLILREAPQDIIQLLLKNTPLLFLKFNVDQIIQMISSPSGYKNIEYALSFKAATLFNFNPDQVVTLVSHPSGFKNLESIRKNQFILKDLGFNTNQLIEIAGKEKGYQTIAVIVALSSELKMLEIPAGKIAQVMIDIRNGRNKLVELIKERCTNSFSSIDFNTTTLTPLIASPIEDTEINWNAELTLEYSRSSMMFGETDKETKPQEKQVQIKASFSM